MTDEQRIKMNEILRDLTPEELDIAHGFGHDVPGFISGELLGGRLRADAITNIRISSTMKEMVKEIRRLRHALTPFAESYWAAVTEGEMAAEYGCDHAVNYDDSTLDAPTKAFQAAHDIMRTREGQR